MSTVCSLLLLFVIPPPPPRASHWEAGALHCGLKIGRRPLPPSSLLCSILVTHTHTHTHEHADRLALCVRQAVETSVPTNQ